ncbi:MAG: hypothetical protein F7C33_04800 [Desulfurococcales archaeon]|nr:hypothetical protein [Desulfurococcales archaeon]
MTVACDEQSPARGGEKEEPNEPPSSDCRLRIYGGARVLREILDEIKRPFYEYNSEISRTGYYLKPVHKVYKRLSDGRRRVYEYYGRYWWRKKGKRLVYSGTRKPARVPLEPPANPLEGLSIIVEDDDIILSCGDYEKFKGYFRGLRVERSY